MQDKTKSSPVRVVYNVLITTVRKQQLFHGRVMDASKYSSINPGGDPVVIILNMTKVE